MIKKRKSLWRRLKENKVAQGVSSVLLPVLFGVLILALWQGQILHKIFNTDTNTLPLPSRICHIIIDNIPAFAQNALYTLLVAVIGLVIGSIIGYLIAVFAATFQKWGKGGLTIVGAFNAIPIVALAPVMTNWTKDISNDPNIRSMFAKTLVVMIVCIASMSINAFRGLTELKPFALDLMKSYAAKKSTVFFKLTICIYRSQGKRSDKHYQCSCFGILCRIHCRCRQRNQRKHSSRSVSDSVGIYCCCLSYRTCNVRCADAG